jgi:hypothetical protein
LRCGSLRVSQNGKPRSEKPSWLFEIKTIAVFL